MTHSINVWLIDQKKTRILQTMKVTMPAPTDILLAYLPGDAPAMSLVSSPGGPAISLPYKVLRFERRYYLDAPIYQATEPIPEGMVFP